MVTALVPSRRSRDPCGTWRIGRCNYRPRLTLHAVAAAGLARTASRAGALRARRSRGASRQHRAALERHREHQHYRCRSHGASGGLSTRRASGATFCTGSRRPPPPVSRTMILPTCLPTARDHPPRWAPPMCAPLGWWSLAERCRFDQGGDQFDAVSASLRQSRPALFAGPSTHATGC